MVDINYINPFPQGIGPVDNGKPEANRSQPSGAQGVNFQDQLMEALGQINEEADQVAEASSSNYENVQQAMDQAKNAFSDTMQAHQMMQHLMMNQMNRQNLPPDSSGGDEGAE